MQVDELYLHGRRFTWSNERRRPIMERIDRAFANVPWLQTFPSHHLRTLLSNSSDHAPLLLQLCTEPWAWPWFRFEPFWVLLQGYEETVQQAWACAPPATADACRILDHKLCNTARALRS
jgi:hypothetical protein